jgi:hypothetical protein
VARRSGRKSVKKWNYHPSKPGEFPHKDTGRLRASIQIEERLDPKGHDSRVRVYSDVKYSRILELSKKRLLFRATIEREAAAVRSILSTQAGGQQ